MKTKYHPDEDVCLPVRGPRHLNPGIRKLVSLLNEAGFVTTDSGDGETHDFECDRSYGYVTILTEPAKMVAEADRLMDLLKSWGLDPIPQMPEGEAVLDLRQCHIEASYSPTDGFAVLDVQHVHDRMLKTCENCGELPCQCCQICGGPCRGH